VVGVGSVVDDETVLDDDEEEVVVVVVVDDDDVDVDEAVCGDAPNNCLK
jgi:hypothetical protein